MDRSQARSSLPPKILLMNLFFRSWSIGSNYRFPIIHLCIPACIMTSEFTGKVFMYLCPRNSIIINTPSHSDFPFFSSHLLELQEGFANLSNLTYFMPNNSNMTLLLYFSTACYRESLWLQKFWKYEKFKNRSFSLPLFKRCNLHQLYIGQTGTEH